MAWGYDPKDYLYDWDRFGKSIGGVLRSSAAFASELYEYNKQLKENKRFNQKLYSDYNQMIDRLTDKEISQIGAAMGVNIDDLNTTRAKIKELVPPPEEGTTPEEYEKTYIRSVIPFVSALGNRDIVDRSTFTNIMGKLTQETGLLVDKLPSTKATTEYYKKKDELEASKEAQLDIYKGQREIEYEYKDKELEHKVKEIEVLDKLKKSLDETGAKDIGEKLDIVNKRYKNGEISLDDYFPECMKVGVPEGVALNAVDLLYKIKTSETEAAMGRLKRIPTTKEDNIDIKSISEIANRYSDNVNSGINMLNNITKEIKDNKKLLKNPTFVATIDNIIQNKTNAEAVNRTLEYINARGGSITQSEYNAIYTRHYKKAVNDKKTELNDLAELYRAYKKQGKKLETKEQIDAAKRLLGWDGSNPDKFKIKDNMMKSVLTNNMIIDTGDYDTVNQQISRIKNNLDRLNSGVEAAGAEVSAAGSINTPMIKIKSASGDEVTIDPYSIINKLKDLSGEEANRNRDAVVRMLDALDRVGMLDEELKSKYKNFYKK